MRDRIYIPGFGHQLYPDGDVRAATLFALLREAVPNSPELAFAERLAVAGERLIDRKPNVDFTTVVVERVLGLPKDFGARPLPAGPHRGLDRPCAGAVRACRPDPAARPLYWAETRRMRARRMT